MEWHPRTLRIISALPGRVLLHHLYGCRAGNHCSGHFARRAATIKKQALIIKGAPTISPIKGSVIKLNTAISTPSTRRMLPTLKLESLSERQDLALMDFLLLIFIAKRAFAISAVLAEFARDAPSDPTQLHDVHFSAAGTDALHFRFGEALDLGHLVMLRIGIF
jgi:hypothetical protein